MAVSIPQVVTEDRASGALVIDGSLRFDESKGQYLKFTPSSSGNRRTQTLSVWIKNTYTGSNNKVILGGGDNASGPRYNIFYAPSKRFGVTQNPTGSANDTAATVGVFRDYSGWQHLVVSLDCTVGQNSGQVRIYVNGKLQENGDYAGGGSAVYITDQDGIFNTISKRMYLGHYAANPSDPAEFDGYMSQYYWIDGLALGPKYFGYTDPLTGTWRPRKFRAEGTTLNDGTNWSGNSTNFTNGDNGFNGNLGNYAEVSSSAVKGTFTFPKSIKVENNITFWFSSGTAGNLFINDEATPMGATGGFHQQDIEFTGTLSSISLQSGSQPVLYGIAVDGIILESTVTQNLDFGTNGVYLPFDGSAPIGQDQSGKGNDYTPVNFGGSADITKATGALPILNTLGGTVARSGVFGSEVSKNYTTTSNTAAGSGYEFDQTSGFNPSLSFVRGATYTFDYTDSSSHPLRFSSTDPDSSVTSYTDGTNTSVSNTVKITVPHNAPDTLYYYCTSHNSMNGSISVTTDTKKADPYASSCVFAAPFISNSLDVSDQINCTSSQKANSSADVGVTYNTTVTTTNFYKSYGVYASAGGSQKVVYSDSADFDLDGPFTIEFFIKMNSDTDCTIICDDGINGDPQVKYTSANDRIQLQSSNVNIEIDESSNTATLLRDGNWHHVAFVRSAVNDTNAIYLFIDGVAQTLRARTNSAGSSVNFNQMALFTGAVGRFPGYMQDLRIYKGVAKYTSNFIPASTNPDILPDTPSGVGTKTQLTKITDGAVAFDGADGTALSLSNHADLQFGTETNWTIEFFAYRNGAFVDYDVIAGKGLGGDFEWFVEGFADGSVDFMYSNDGTTTWSGQHELMSSMGLNRWYHFAFVRNGSGANNFKMYVDGKQVFQTTAFDIHVGNGNLHIGGYTGATAQDPPIKISNFRMVKGTSVYTSEFIPPTRALTNVTNTKLLCCQEPTEGPVRITTVTASGALPILNTNDDGTSVTSGNRSDGNSSSIVLALPLYNNSNDIHADIKGSGSNKTITENGNVTSSSAQSQFYGGSYVFDGNGDFLRTTVTGGFGDGDFTMEFWYYKTADSGQLFNNRTNGDQADGFDVNHNLYTSTSNLSMFSAATVSTNKWTHVAFVRNSGTLKRYIDGVESASISNSTNFSGTTFSIGGNDQSGGNVGYLTGYMQDFRVYVGVAKYTSDFDPAGIVVLRPQFAVSPGTIVSNGNAAATNFNPFTTDINTVRGQEGTYATLNPLKKTPNLILSEGNLKVGPQGNTWNNVASTIGMTTGKFYFECVPAGYQYTYVGIANADSLSFNANGNYMGGTSNDWGYLSSSGELVNNTSSIYTTGVTAYGGDVIGITFDCATKEGRWYVNGVLQYTHTLSGNYPFFFGGGSYTSSSTWNFGQKPFKFTPPDGFQPLTSSTVRPDTVIARPDQYVRTTLYTGDDNDGRTITLGHEADLVWVKGRNAAAGHVWQDTVRGPGQTVLATSSTALQTTETYGQISAFTKNGITVTSGSTSDENINYPSRTYVAWSWKAGGSKGTFNVDDVGYATAAAAGLSASGNSWDSDPTGASIGTKQGFSIIKHSGTGSTGSLPHGLTQKPDLLITKAYNGTTGNWNVYTDLFDGSNDYMYFNDSSQKGNSSLSAFTSELFYYGYTANDYIHYLWHSVPGLQKFGTYTGNLSTDGPYVELGFRPAIILCKSVTNGNNWFIKDNKRSTSGANPVDKRLYPNENNDEMQQTTYHEVDFLSNGFKLRGNGGEDNASGDTILYAAWAEAPTFNLYGAQSNAR